MLCWCDIFCLLVTYLRRGIYGNIISTSFRVQEKLSGLTTGYSVEQAQVIVAELKNIEESLRAGEKEKAELIKSLNVLREDIISAETTQAIQANMEAAAAEKHSTGSQTDFCGEVQIKQVLLCY